MTRSHAARPSSPDPATLAQQKTDFTAEGSPPPGRVSTATPAKPKPAAGAPAAGRRPVHRRKPVAVR